MRLAPSSATNTRPTRERENENPREREKSRSWPKMDCPWESWNIYQKKKCFFLLHRQFSSSSKSNLLLLAECLLPQLFWCERVERNIKSNMRRMRNPNTKHPNTRNICRFMLAFLYSVFSPLSLPVFIIIYLYYYIYCTNTIRSLFFRLFGNGVEKKKETNTMIPSPIDRHEKRQRRRRMRH